MRQTNASLNGRSGTLSEIRPEQAAFEFRLRWELNTDADVVDVSSLSATYRPITEDLSAFGCLGYAMYLRTGVHSNQPADIYIEQSLNRFERRAVYAHEIGHIECKHPPSAVTHSLSQWKYEQYERKAGIFAAMILIPGHLMLLEVSREEVAYRANVPVELVHLYWDSVLNL